LCFAAESDLIKVLWYDGDGMCLFAKRLERGASFGRKRRAHGFVDAGAVIDAAGRYRLAAAGADVGAAAVGVNR